MNFYHVRPDKYLIRSYTIKVHVVQNFYRERPDKILHDKDFWSAPYQILHDKNSRFTGIGIGYKLPASGKSPDTRKTVAINNKKNAKTPVIRKKNECKKLLKKTDSKVCVNYCTKILSKKSKHLWKDKHKKAYHNSKQKNL